jgi:hypothetical protein
LFTDEPSPGAMPCLRAQPDSAHFIHVHDDLQLPGNSTSPV